MKYYFSEENAKKLLAKIEELAGEIETDHYFPHLELQEEVCAMLAAFPNRSKFFYTCGSTGKTYDLTPYLELME